MPIQTQTFSGAPGGMNLAVPPQEIADEEARFIIDGWVDQPGIVRRRGPVEAVSGTPTLSSQRITGLCQVLDPQGSHRVAVLSSGGTGDDDLIFRILADDYSTYDVAYTLIEDIFDGSDPFLLVDCKPMLDQGMLIGVSTHYGLEAMGQGVVMWRGSNTEAYSTGTINEVVARGDTEITFTGTTLLTNTSPGSFLFRTQLGTDQLMGVVESITDDTTLVLEQGSLMTAAIGDTFRLDPVRGLNKRIAKGSITTVTDETTVNGTFTKFLSQEMDSGTWDIFRANDMTYIGTVSSVASDSQLTLTANAAIEMNNEDYLAINRDGNYDVGTHMSHIGFLNAVYAGRQFYANHAEVGPQGSNHSARIWFSDPLDPEALDTTESDGDHIEITSTKGVSTAVRGLVPTQSALVIFKEDETYAMFGSSPAQFAVRKIADDGIFTHMSATPYEGGVIWAGRFGIYFWDGVMVRNLTNENMGDYYVKMVRNFEPDTHRMWSMLVREHYILFIEDITDNPVEVLKNATTESYTAIGLALNLRTGALVLLTPNVAQRASIELPANTGHNVWYAVNNSAGNGIICDGELLFDDEGGNDTFSTDVGTAGPDFYMESKRYAIADPQIKKLFKQVQLHYVATVTSGTDDITNALRLDTVVGLNEPGSLSSSRFRQQTDYNNKRIKFLKRSTHLGFRLYQESSSVTRVVVGPWALGFKFMRPGRV